MTNKKILRRVLVLADSPTVASGFGVLTKNLLKQLQATGKYLIDIIGINYHGDFYDTVAHPYRLYTAVSKNSQDLFGRPRAIESLAGKDHALVGPWDIFFTVNDHFILEVISEPVTKLQEQLKKLGYPESQFKWIGYYPIDSSLRENWVNNSIMKPDYPIVYTEYGKNEVLKFDKDGKYKDKLEVIYHGVNTEEFYPISDEEKKKFRKEYFGGKVGPDTFLITNISRNQYRKDIARTMKIYSEFKKRHPDSYLYLHSKVQDAGGSLEEIARNFGLRTDEDWTTPGAFDENKGYPVDIINKIYNISDVTISTTMGEGWGFYLTESMAAGTLTMGPTNTSVLEILGSDKIDDTVRGIPIDCGTNSSEWFCGGLQDNERIRPLTNVEDGVKKLSWVYDNPTEAAVIAKRGHEWAKQLNWRNIYSKWDRIFEKAWSDLEKDRTLRQSEINKLELNSVGRK